MKWDWMERGGLLDYDKKKTFAALSFMIELPNYDTELGS